MKRKLTKCCLHALYTGVYNKNKKGFNICPVCSLRLPKSWEKEYHQRLETEEHNGYDYGESPEPLEQSYV